MEISVEGVVLPNKPLTNVELLNAANKLGIPYFRGVFQRDALPKRSRKGECGILNLDDSPTTGHVHDTYVGSKKDGDFRRRSCVTQ